MPCSEKTSAFICRCAALFLSLYKISGTRANKSELFCRSFASSLYKLSCGSAVSSLEKLSFPVLPLHLPCIIFVKDKRRLVICDHPFPCDVFLSKHVAAWRMMRQQLIT